MPAEGSVIFQATTADGADGYYATAPRRIIQASLIDDVPEAIDAAESAARDGCFVAGYVAYEAGAAFEPQLPRRTIDLPYAWFAVYDDAGRISRARLQELLHPGSVELDHLRFSIQRPRYRNRIAAIRELIREGDVYQINYTGQLRFDLEGEPESLFRALVERQPVPYAAYLDLGPAQILSCSPELFFRRDGARIVTRPMKGTATRGATPAEDDDRAQRLAADEKNRAENLMIVDLLRNDLSRCCVPGSVRTPKLFETERYETLIQMSSEVEGDLLPEASLLDIFRALFPCGSITGAPKIRAMQRIDALEDEPRGVYCGAVGFIEPGGDAVFNVAIRTAVVRDGVGRLGIGSGVVWDSEADAEFDECLLKARFLTGGRAVETEPFYLIETMRADGGEIELLELHLDRLLRSAEYFGMAVERLDVAEYVHRVVAARTPHARDEEPVSEKVRLTVGESGGIQVETVDLPPPAERKPLRAVVSETRIDSGDPFRRHKTSRRNLYNEKYEKARQLGYDEVLFLNERGEVAEGSRTNIFVRSGRAWRTPPVESGALPGVYRRHLIESMPGLTEDVLYISDLIDADAVYLSNAVIGLVEAEVIRHDGRVTPGAPAGEARCVAETAQG